MSRLNKEKGSMATFKVGIIGCGRPWKTAGATGFGQGHVHAEGYEASPECAIVAAADIKQENLDAFCQEHQVPHGYLDYGEMLAREDLDIVSVCLWPELHAPVVIDVAQAGVKAIHCEKPMAPTWGESKRMAAVCEAQGVQLTFNHQRRFGRPFRKAKGLLDDGAIGQLTRLEAFASNLYDWGTHWFDMMFFYNDEEPVEWVIGQIDARGGRPIFGVTVEGQGLSFFKWRNGVYGLMVAGDERLYQHAGVTKGMECGNRLIGTEGAIEVGVRDGPEVRLRNVETGSQWQDLDVGGRIHGHDHDVAAIRDLVDALKTGREPELSARKALQATELIFATYESSRRRGRVELPLEIGDSPFLSMLASGEMSVGEENAE
jgi:UDP-N-acetylglucosamine 3-dehydrogenase